MLGIIKKVIERKKTPSLFHYIKSWVHPYPRRFYVVLRHSSQMNKGELEKVQRNVTRMIKGL